MTLFFRASLQAFSSRSSCLQQTHTVSVKTVTEYDLLLVNLMRPNVEGIIGTNYRITFTCVAQVSPSIVTPFLDLN